MGFLSRKIERSQLVGGDHIYTWRAAFTYSHHGIYIGESKVVHFTDAFGSTPGPFSWCSSCVPSASNSIPSGCPNFSDCGTRQPRSGVVLACLDCFLAKGSLYRFDYGVRTYGLLTRVSGTCTTAESDPPEETLHRANYLLQHGFGDYLITSNNCEHFAMYCKTGYVCIFGGIGQAAAVQAPIAAVGAIGSLAMLIPGVRMATMTATAVGTYFASKYANDLGIRVDVRKLQVEDLVVLRGSVNPTNTASDEMETANSGGDSNSEADGTDSEDVQPVGEGSVAPPSIDEIIKELQKPLKADRADDLLRIDETLRCCAQAIKDDWVKKLDHSSTTANNRSTIVEIDADGTSEEMRHVQPVGEGSSVASFIGEIIKELEKPPMADHENNLVRMYETLRSCARTIKDDFVRELVKMDPLAPKEMIVFANSSLKFLSLFPFDELDSLYFSVKNFIVRAYELAYEKRKVHSDSLDFHTKLEEARERIRVLTEKQNRLELLSSEADQLEQTSKELSELELTAIFRSSGQDLISAHLAGLEAAMEDSRARILSQEA